MVETIISANDGQRVNFRLANGDLISVQLHRDGDKVMVWSTHRIAVELHPLSAIIRTDTP